MVLLGGHVNLFISGAVGLHVAALLHRLTAKLLLVDAVKELATSCLRL